MTDTTPTRIGQATEQRASELERARRESDEAALSAMRVIPWLLGMGILGLVALIVVALVVVWPLLR